MFCYDITWCAEECEHLECERNLKNKPSDYRIFSMAYLKDTDFCLLNNIQSPTADNVVHTKTKQRKYTRKNITWRSVQKQ